MVRDERDPRDDGELRDARDERQLSDPVDPRDKRSFPDPRDERQPFDPRDTRQPFDLADGGRWPVPLIAVTAGYFLIGLGLVFQAPRFSNTPSYANLINILPSPAWGAIYLVAATLMGTAALLPTVRALTTVATTFGIALTAAWLLAFVVRYLTDDGTTIVNVVSWSVFCTVLAHSASRLIIQGQTGSAPKVG